VQIGSTAKMDETGHVQISAENDKPFVTYNSNDAAYLAYVNNTDVQDFMAKWQFDNGSFNYKNIKFNLINKQLNKDLE